MNDLSEIGLLRREIKDVRAIAANIDHRTRKLIEPHAIRRPGGLIARLAACELLARSERRSPIDLMRQHFADDADLRRLIELKGATAPAQTTVATWAAELVGTVVTDIADNLLPASALSQLRALGLEYMFIDGAVARVPIHAPTPSGGFVAEGGAIPVGALIISGLGLKPKKAAAITALTRELLQGTPANIETSLRVLLAQDVGLMIDGILLGNAAASNTQPAGLLNGLTPVAATAGGGVNALLGDIKKLLGAIAPAIKPVLIVNSTQAATFGILAPTSALPVIVAPYLAADSVIALDAACFASALGAPDIETNEDPTIHMETAPLAIGMPGAPPVVASPTQSLFQTACIGMRTIIDADWLLRRSGAVAVVNSVTW